jgi:diacylglycerol kinase family enzyme
MSIQSFADRLSVLLKRSPLFPGRPIEAVLIANPRAGGFTRKYVHERHLKELDGLEIRAAALPFRTAPTSLRLILTESPNHASKITRDLADQAAADRSGAEHLIIIAGGDGTGLEVLSTLFALPPEVREKFTVIRLPMGTGNDGSDARELPAALGRIIDPARIDRHTAIKVVSANPGHGPWLAFNIASVGLDAYVCEMTNRLKGVFPGNSYKFWVDIASVFYEKTYRLTPSVLDLFDAAGAKTGSIEETLLIVAMGISGHRTYGSNKLILPDEDNVCAVKQMSFLRKIAIKDRITRGQHRAFPEVSLRSADRITIMNDCPLPMQLDGEVVRLDPSDFPLTMALTEPLIRVIRYA